MQLKGSAYGIRTSLENFCACDIPLLYPLYAIMNAMRS